MQILLSLKLISTFYYIHTSLVWYEGNMRYATFVPHIMCPPIPIFLENKYLIF